MSLTLDRAIGLRSPVLARGALVLVCAVAAASVWVTSGPVPELEPEYIRLMRAMTAMKALMAAAAAAAVLWRLAGPVGGAWFAAYAAACAAMAAGPVMIWGMAQIGTGALLLHGGLAATLLLLWRDPAVAQLLRRAVTARRSRIALRDARHGG